MWHKDDPQGNDAGKILWELVPYTRGFGLDIGCGAHKAFPHFVGVDNRKDTQLFSQAMDPDFTVPDATTLPMFSDGACDFIFSSHLLEHLDDYKTALKEWWRLVKVGGHMCLYLPHKELYPNIGKGGNPDHKHDFVEQDILDVMDEFPDWNCLRNEKRDQDMEYSFFQVFRKLESGKGQLFDYKKTKPAKTAAIVRYGAWGDSLQSCSVFPGLKRQGFHITLYSTPRSYEVIKHDPNIDEVILQDTDQVPNSALGSFWGSESKKYDRWINLSESVEGTWLTLADRMQSRWPDSVRQKHLNYNYVQFQHEIAEVPYKKPEAKFYATQEEKNWAIEQRIEMKAKPLILWVLNGSSIHKVWPHIDQIFARMMITYPECKIVTVGDKKSLMLDEPWKNEPRILRKAGDWSIRNTLAFAQVCDMVIGPETGVLSGISMEDIPKIVFLSHSSHENLTRDWVNAYALFSTKTPCYPCHKMIYNWDQCVKNEDKDKYWTGTAQCQVDLPPEACWMAIGKALNTPHVLTQPVLLKRAGGLHA